MKTFLAVYIGTEDALKRIGWREMEPEVRTARETAGIAAWTDWGAAHAAAILDPGGPLGRTKQASPEGIADIRNAVTGYVIVRAETHETAARMFEAHPHFTHFPGDSVEIMEILPLPGG